MKCIGTGSSVDSIGKSQCEDCLFINVFAPTKVTQDSRLPVFVFIQGGGFNQNSDAHVNSSGIIQAADMDVVVVTVNYRVGPYSFLEDDDKVTPNIGLHDQRKALHWVKKHVARFGGDPGRVTLGGASAGATSVAHHLSAYGGRDEGLSHAVAAESVSFANMLTVKQSVYWAENLAIRLGCAGKDALACLRSRSAEEIQEAKYNIPFPGGSEAPLFMWGPVVGGDLVPAVTYKLFAEGNFIRVPALVGDDTNGGTVFTLRKAATLAESDAFLKNQYPALTLERLGAINDLYPNENDTCPSPGCYWRQVSDVYGQMRYMCLGLYISATLARHNFSSSWNYLYDVQDPDQVNAGLGVPHTAEVNAVFGPEYVGGGYPASYADGGVNVPVTPVVQGYWTSFMRTHDLNTRRRSGSVEWESWTEEREQRMVFGTGGETKMEEAGGESLGRCEYFADIGSCIHQ